ncbi:MAG: caspase family protein, partial [Desulfobacterales bacterium]|nr:caspase family protein [Desulfobacterales bacterium]
DAMLVKDYIKALGVKERNIELLTDEKATLSGIMKSIEAWLPNKLKKDGNVFVYYSGHGSPDPVTGEAFIVPYDGDPNYLAVTGYPLKRLYENLAKLEAKEIIVVLDSCFSGSGGRSVPAKGTRPLVMMAATEVASTNMAVLTATQGSQISTSSPEKGHGVFTYYFLKALKEGKMNLAEIYETIKPQVEDEAKRLNVRQSPSISPNVEKLRDRFILRK